MIHHHLFTASTTAPFIQFFKGESDFNDMGIRALSDTYEWGIPSRTNGLFDTVPGNDNYTRNVNLKLILQRRWQSSPGTRRQIIEWIISTWGGIRGNSTKTLDRYETLMDGDLFDIPLAGIASFSKVLAVYDPFKYAIYDARVAVSLNAIQLIAGSTDAYAFPYLSGRNNITGNWSSKPKVGFSTLPQHSIKTLTYSSNWTKVERRLGYFTYLQLLNDVCDRSGGKWKIYELEMALFSQAPTLACMAEPSLAP